MTQQRTWIAGLAILLGAACLGMFCLAAAGGTALWLQRSPAAESEPAGVETATSRVTFTQTPGTPLLIPTRTPRPALATPTPTHTPTPDISPATPPGFITAIPNPAGPATPQTTQAGSGAIPPTETIEPGSAPGAPVGPDATGLGCLTWNATAMRAPVRRVVDGITLEVEIDGQLRQVRYIGAGLLDYSSDPNVWVRATEKNQELAAGKTVLLYRDVLDQDESGRLLRYVIAGGKLLNYEIIADGYANAESMPPNTRCDALLLSAEGQALAGSLGLWQPTATATRTLVPLPTATVATTGNMAITLVSKRGTIWQEPEEFVEIRNDSGGPINLEGWTLQDNERHVFVFPRFLLGNGQYCRVYTNEYHPGSCGFSYNSYSPIWDNETDCAYLKDSLGMRVSTLCYGY